MGIEAAQGEYLSFIDSDDWIHPQMIEILYSGIVKNNVLLSICTYEEVETYDNFKKVVNSVFEVCYSMDFLITNNVNAVIPVAKLYHKSVFENLRYPVGKYAEDEFLTYKVLYVAGDIAFCREKLYKYFINVNGLSKEAWSVKHLDKLEALEERDKWLIQHKLFKYRKWSRRQLLQVYWRQYNLIGSDKRYRYFRSDISKK